ncbi:hypothetical protein [Dysgonomonas sp. 520]|uniref:hypothetical protein n=1 Tax=Dysgonomonas sp. 520 TaxID=2302931 RepID=UPI0013D44BBE|nr:hypothetical protein [Dysgonomonas sp. 520]NDW08184.1 hypothetical protein [Dysgonomonas sp. 520]
MKKYLFILITMICFTINVNADGGKTCEVKNSETTIGYVTAYVDKGCLYVSNDTNRRVTVTVTYYSGSGQGETVVSVDAGKTHLAKTDLAANAYVVKVKNPICQ